MKRRLSLLLALVLLLSLGLSACGGAGPDQTAKDFIKIVKEGEADKLKDVCTESFAAEASMMIAGIGMMKAADENFKFEASDFKVEKEEGDSAVVKFTMTISAGDEEDKEESTMNLIKKDGKWLVESVN